MRQGSGSSEAPRVRRDQPRDLVSVSSCNSKQPSRIPHFCFHPSVCGNLNSNAFWREPVKTTLSASPGWRRPRHLFNRSGLCQMVFSYWRALTPDLFSNRTVKSRLRTPEPPVRWLSLAEDRHLPLLRSQPRCPPPGLHAGQLPLPHALGLRSKGGGAQGSPLPSANGANQYPLAHRVR